MRDVQLRNLPSLMQSGRRRLGLEDCSIGAPFGFLPVKIASRQIFASAALTLEFRHIVRLKFAGSLIS